MLVDSRVLLWALADDDRLGSRARERMVNARTRYVSAVTHVELTIKAMRGKIRVPADFAALVSAAGYESLPLEDKHVAGLRSFESLERHDPFDRMLVAQAFVEGIPLLTADRVLLDLDLAWVIDAAA